jgi:ParB/RepB/Spo0J family partition protein
MEASMSGTGEQMVSVDKLEPNAWNPQVMEDAKFNELVEEIREDGFDDAIHVVKHPDPDKESAGIYMIVDGEHRWQAARVLGIAEIPCVVKDNWPDEKTQKIKTVRRNLLHGDLDRARFTKLAHSLNDVGIPIKELPSVLGFSNEAEFREKFVAQERQREEQAQQRAAKSAKEEEKRESAVVNNLSFILNEIFSEYGDTVPQGFIFFCHKNKYHLLVQMDDKLEGLVESAVKYLRATGKNVNALLRRALDTEFDSIKQQDGIDPRKTRNIKGSDGDVAGGDFLDDGNDTLDDDFGDGEMADATIGEDGDL